MRNNVITTKGVTPAKAGVQSGVHGLAPGFRRGDKRAWSRTFAGMAAITGMSALVFLLSTIAFADEADYTKFNTWCINNLGAEKEPLAYQMFGNSLSFREDGFWSHVSENSAVIAFETNLPAYAYVEYGPTTAYGMRTDIQERPFYLHQHYLRNLAPNTTYHYRFVATDERGNRIYSSDDGTLPDRQFTTLAHGGASVRYIPGDVPGPTYHLTEPGVTYRLTQDLVVDTQAIVMQGQNITLDLNGHTIVYNNVHMVNPGGMEEWDWLRHHTCGILVYYGSPGVRILNGVVRQGAGNDSAGEQSEGFSPVTALEAPEIAGITVIYSGNQVSGIKGWGEVHHNVVRDIGTDIVNRHLGCYGIMHSSLVHHNLVKRARQTAISGVNGHRCYRNEIYLDSCATNSFGIGYYQNRDLVTRDNRIFGTGYHALGIGMISTGVGDAKVYGNFIHMKTLPEPEPRWAEYGLQSGVNGFRVTWGGNNIEWYNNIVVVDAFGTGAGEVRGVWHVPQADQSNLVYHDNIFKAIGYGTKPLAMGAIDISGGAATDVAPGVFRNNIIMSNFCNISLGDSYYGSGSNGFFIDNDIVRLGNDSYYRTIYGRTWDFTATGHVFIDSNLEGGANFDSFAFTGNRTTDFSVGHSLYVICRDNSGNTLSSRDIEVHDNIGRTFAGQTDASGQARLHLIETTRKSIVDQSTFQTINHTGHYAQMPGYYPAALPFDISRNAANPYPLVFTLNTEPAPPTIISVGGQLLTGNPIRLIGYGFEGTPGSVIIANNADFTAAGIKQTQSIISWSDTFIRFTMNQGSFAQGQAAYLFVQDQSGERNPLGYPITIGTGFTDRAAPQLRSIAPADGQVYVSRYTNITVVIYDDNPGIDPTSIVMTANGQTVSPQITSHLTEYTLSYTPPSPFAYGQTVTVGISCRDWDNNSMQETASFTIEAAPAYSAILWSATERTGDSFWKNSGVTYCPRILLEGSHLVSSATQVALEFQGRTDNKNYTIKSVSIAEADLTAGRGNVVDDTWTKVTFDGRTEATWDSDQITVPAKGTKVSNVLDFTIDPAKSYYVTFKVVTESVYLNVPSDFGELYYNPEDHSGDMDWAGAGYVNDYHAFARLYGVGVDPVNRAPRVNAGPPQTIVLPREATLTGSVTDDGLPAGSTLTFTWSEVSGANGVAISSPAALRTTVQFPAEGTYVLRLTASDGALSGSGDVTLTVKPAGTVNQAPTVDAGPNQSISLGDTLTLRGTAADDGLPNPPGRVTTTWTRVSGPGTVTFGKDSDSTTTARFSAAGTYTLRLFASDGDFTVSDDVAITVIGSGEPGLPPSGSTPPDINLIDPSRGLETATLYLYLERSMPVKADVFHIQTGEFIKTLVNTDLPAGLNEIYWDGRNEDGKKVAAGIYLVKTQKGTETIDTRKVAVLR